MELNTAHRALQSDSKFGSGFLWNFWQATLTMKPLSSKQNEAIATELAGIRTAYNQFDVKPCHFTGIPDDLSSLDYIPYELPMADEYIAGSPAFSIAWGHVLVTSFGFCWVASDNRVDPRMFALHHQNPSVLLFPYFRLCEITQSSGPHDSPAESLWFDTIQYFEQRSHIPDGWHPVFDAVRCPNKLGCPSSLTSACRRLIDTVPNFYFTMSTYPYLWAREKKWDDFREYAEQLAKNHR